MAYGLFFSCIYYDIFFSCAQLFFSSITQISSDLYGHFEEAFSRNKCCTLCASLIAKNNESESHGLNLGRGDRGLSPSPFFSESFHDYLVPQFCLERLMTPLSMQ
jgi:hypothetical protein